MYKTFLMMTAATLLVTACASTKEEAAAPAPAPAAQAAPPPPQRSVTQISGDVYRWQNNEHFGIVLVTSDEIIVADPINREGSEWLKGELAARFPGKEVKYVLYSHHHYDHVSGAAAFPNARVIAQADAKKNLQPPPANAPLTGFMAGADANKDNMIQKSEVADNPFFGPQFESFDLDKNGNVTASELFTAQYADVRIPDGSFKDDYTLTLGGQSVRMIHVGGSHASDMSLMIFPGNVLLVVDLINLKRLPFGTLSDYDLDENFANIDKVASYNPTFISGGHGALGTMSDLADVRQYFEDLISGVQAGINAGKSLEQIQAELTLDKYKDWGNYQAFRTQNIAGIYAKLTAKG